MDNKKLEQRAKEIRKIIFKTAYKGKSGHIASAFSIVEVLTVLYFAEILNYDKENPFWENRDKVIMSKGHAVLALYSIFSMIGYIKGEELDTYCQIGSKIGGEPKLGDVPGIEATTGSLGHGLSFGVGIAMANKLDCKDARVYVILGDGECQEGSVWEAVISAGHHNLDNLTVILDNNKLQAMGELDEILTLSPMADKWNAFGWDVTETNGHDMEELYAVLKQDRIKSIKKPRIVIANTVKGKGISFMERVPIWHYRLPNEEELKTVMKELQISKEELGL